MFEIRKKFKFEASHELKGLKPWPGCPTPDHPCTRNHGHSYTAEFVFQAKNVGHDGFLIDYDLLKPIGKFLDEKLDHRFLNDVEEFKDLHNPSAELMAYALYAKFKASFSALAEVRIYETEKTVAIYRGGTLI